MRNKEERVKKITRTSVLITGFIISAYGYIMYFINSFEDKWVRLVIVSVFIIFTMLVVFFGRERIFNTILRITWIPNSKNRKILGQWDIYIFFNKNEHFDRAGTLNFEDSYAGLSIKGNNLTDNKGNVTVERWFAQEAEIYHYADDKIILVYQYWLQDDANKDKYSKLGIVTAISDDGGNCFKGTFKDIILENGEIAREGKVTINKCDASVIKNNN